VWGFPGSRPVQLPTTGWRLAEAVWKKYGFIVNVEHCHFGWWNNDLWVTWQLYQLQNLRRVEDMSTLIILQWEGLIIQCDAMFVLIHLIFWPVWLVLVDFETLLYVALHILIFCLRLRRIIWSRSNVLSSLQVPLASPA
jgi:hypothetical protein